MPGHRAPLRIGLLNMMADAALRATERQFARLLQTGEAQDPILVPFTLPEIARSGAARDHIARSYQPFDQVRQEGLDGLIITGVNLSDPRLEVQPFWDPLIRVFTWAEGAVAATLCSCLATHAVLQFHDGQRRRPLPGKLWGVYRQDVVATGHRLTRGLGAAVEVPHSRHNDVAAGQFTAAGLEILIAGGGAGVHLAARPDLSLTVMQGHPEYDTISLLKEYKRELGRFLAGRRDDDPPLPENYLAAAGRAILARYRARLTGDAETVVGGFPEAELVPHLVDRWAGPAARFFANWLVETARLNGRTP